ncbi:PBP1A family penicillin-binding protein [Methyloligella sp. 2.7D]|uniref:transglycosylase domain-containing protein n=1 Tax=unclassified Methyloligella TaxID=2625955 RepID=UPI00157CE1CE|nr:PBP1A family penicillin-binding protein [Methyloligella sp. GL2]QKP77101.1 PBP1A family penicillin-binding protein [Methyloligella sp. GL2]
MRDFFGGKRRRKLIDWLAIDAWIDSGLYGAWMRIRDWMSAYATFFGRFEARGPWKVLNELACESLTMGTAGLLVVAAFAIPAFDIAQGKINLSDEYSVTFLDRYGNEIGHRGLLRDDSVPLEEIPDNLIKATLATEDRRFFEHFGIDIFGTLRAMVANAREDSVVQGGSSLTQQLAKNMFLSPERSLSRKVKEAFIALYLEAHYSKKELMKLYFDRAYLGGGSYGVEAAAQYYFGKSVRDLNLAQCAMLAGMFKAPTRYAPHVNLAASRARTNQVLSNMVEAGYMTEGQVYSARQNPAKIVERSDFYAPDWFLDYAFEEVRRLLKGKSQHIVVARTTVDVPLQKMAEQAIHQTMVRYSRSRRFDQGALVAMESDGAVRAMVGGKDYGESQFNRATQAYRQPGSSFKPYVYLAGLEHGYTPDTIVRDGYVQCGRWSPKNYSGGYRGAMTLRSALARSINTVAVKVSLDVGRDVVLDNMKKMGITHLKKTCSMALGDTGMTPLQHTGGYAVFASGGLDVKPYGVEEIKTLTGELVYSRDRDEPPLKQIFDPQAVATLNNMLQTVVVAGTGRRAQLDYTNSVGKTGTSSNYRDAWFMGFTGQYVVGVWLGNDDFTPMGRVTGGSFPAETWHNFMVMAHDTDNIPQIPGVPLHPRQVAERQRLAMAPSAIDTKPIAAPSDDNLKDMPPGTRAILERIGTLLEETPTLSPQSERTETWPPDEPQRPAPDKRAENDAVDRVRTASP